jgi:dTDP-4-dehydrorhamnose reductase
MRVLIAGCNGLLGQSLTLTAPAGFKINGIGNEAEAARPAALATYHRIDITDAAAFAQAVTAIQPDCIINAAAITDVDLCEREPALCARVNRDAPIAMASLKIPMVQVSTDYVFDGIGGPYREEHAVNPLSVYGKTKWESEVGVLAAHPQNLVVRTMLLWGRMPGGKTSFPDFIRNSLTAGKRVRIVTDQIGNPTLAEDLALGIWALLQKQCRGVYHIAGAELMSRLQWAEAVARHYGLDTGLIDTCLTADLGQAAKRPLSSGLICDKLTQATGFRPRGVADQMKAMTDAI